MRSLIIIAAVTALAAARPELYREKEDFQYSRSSTDEGSKSGFYGAQRGNMGGNYERAHNMDGLAQHQMSGLIQQTEGELGDAAKMRTGSVYTAANSRGTYGSGRYNLNNLEGRNFQEGVSYDDSQLQSSQRNSAFRQHSSGSNSYTNSYSHNYGQRNSQQSEHQGHDLESSNMQDGLYHQQEYAGYSGISGLSHTLYPQSRLVNTRPVKIMVRPGSRVSVPVATQTYNADHMASSHDSSSYGHNSAKSDTVQTYNADHKASSYDSSSYDHNSIKSDAAQTYNADHGASSYDSSLYDHNAAKSDAEVIIRNDQEKNLRYPKNKHYEQSYSYRKEWEKHDTSSEIVPLSIPTESSLHVGSQLHGNSQMYNTRDNYQRSGANSHSNQYNVKTASTSQGRYRSNHNSQQESLSSSSDSNTHINAAHHSGSDADYLRQLANSQTSNTNSMPQSYQSSYSYHKSWERQGDPYVIVPVANDNQNGQTSQRMTDSNGHTMHSSHHYGSQHKQLHQSYTNSNGLDSECDDQGHIRVARSYDINDELHAQQNQQLEQAQNGWDNFGQHIQSRYEEPEDLGQQSQNKWDNLEDQSQQTQNSWDKVEYLGQQTENKWDNLEDLGQQTQNKWDKIEDLGQQSQNSWDRVEDFGQQTQNKWDKIDNFGQQTQNSWDKIEGNDQQPSNKWDNIDDLSQQSQTQWDGFKQSQSNTDQHHNSWNIMEQSGIHTNSNNYGSEKFLVKSDQQFEDNWNLKDQVPQNSDSFQSQNTNEQETVANTDTSRITQNTTQDFKKSKNSTSYLWDKIDTFDSLQNNREVLNSSDKFFNKPQDFDNNATFYDKHTNVEWKNVNNEHHIIPPNIYYDENKRQNSNSSRYDSSSLNNFWNKIDTFDLESPLSFNTDVKSTNIDKQSNYSNIVMSTTMKTKVQNTVTFPQEIERGDIGAADFEIETVSTTTQRNHMYSDFNTLEISNKYKTREQIEALSLIKDNNVSDLNTIGNSNKTHNINDAIPDAIKLSTEAEKYLERKNYTLGQTSDEFNQRNLGQNSQDLYQQNKEQNLEGFGQHSQDSNQQNMEKKSEEFGQHNLDLHQQNIEQNLENFEQHSQDSYQQNMEHNLENSGQHSQDSRQQNMEQNLEKFGQHTQDLHQQNMEQNLEDFGQHSQNLHQQNMEQNLEDFGQHSYDLNQQNMEQNLEDFGQHSQDLHQQNMEQSLEAFGQHSQDLHQQNMEQKFEDFGQHSYDLNQQNMEQNLEDFGQYSQDLHQQNLKLNLEDFGQHSQDLHQQNMEENLEDFGQHSQDLHQQNMEQNLEDFGQHSQDLDQQNNKENLEVFGHHNQDLYQQNMEHNLRDFGQHSQDLKQNIDQKPNIYRYSEHIGEHNLNDKNGEIGHQSFQNRHHSQNMNEEEIKKIENKYLDEQNVRGHDQNREKAEKTYNQAPQLQNMNNAKSYYDDYNKRDDHETIKYSEIDPRLVEENKIISTTPASVSEKPGFWSSVGNKLSKAKNKIASWFQST